MLVAVVVLDLVKTEDNSTSRTSCATGGVVAILIAGVLVGEFEMSLEI